MSEFGVLDLDDIQGEGTRLATKAGAQNFLDKYVPMPKVKPGGTGLVLLRILPPANGKKLYQYTRLHTINGRSVHCPKPLIQGKWDKNTPCPICNYYNSLWAQIDKLEDSGQMELAEKLKQEARSIKPVERYYYNAIIRKLTDDKGEVHLNVGPRIWSVGKTVHQMIVRAIVGDDTEKGLGDITHPKNGYDFNLKIEMTSSGKDAFPNYNRSTFARDPSPLGTPEEVAKWVEGLHDLSTLRILKGLDHLKKELAIHRGLIPDDKQQFNVDEFDAEFRGPASSTTATSVSVPAGVESVHTEVVAETAPANIAEDVSIDNEEFLKELQDMT